MSALKKLKKKGISIISSADIKKHGLSPKLLHYYAKKGALEHVGYGIYRFPETPVISFEDIIRETLAAVPQAVIGLHTALQLHDLTEMIPPNIDLLVPTTNVPKRKLENINLYQMKPQLLYNETEKKNGIPITKIERTIIDLLRYDEPLSAVIKVINEIRSQGRAVDLTKIKKLALKYRVKAKVQRLMEAII